MNLEEAGNRQRWIRRMKEEKEECQKRRIFKNIIDGKESIIQDKFGPAGVDCYGSFISIDFDPIESVMGTCGIDNTLKEKLEKIKEWDIDENNITNLCNIQIKEDDNG